MTQLTYSRNGKTYSVDPNELKPDALQYLLQYGWAQSLQDSIAGREKKVREELFSQFLKDNNGQTPEEKGEREQFNSIVADSIANDLDGQLLKRSDAILSGTITTRVSGESRDPLRAIANDMISKALVKKGTNKKTVGKDKFDSLVEDLLTNKREKVVNEFERRKALDVEIDLD